MGTGTITGVNEIGWLEVSWHNGEVGAYCPNALDAPRTGSAARSKPPSADEPVTM